MPPKKRVREEGKEAPAKAVSSNRKRSKVDEKLDLVPLDASLDVASLAASSGILDPLALTSGDPNSGSTHQHSCAALVRLSKVIAPDCSGIHRVAVHPDSTELVVARENGSLVRYSLHYFQNVPHFTQARHSGGSRRRTITSLHYWIPFGFPPRMPAVLIATYLSGRVVLYDSQQLFPIFVHQRTGGAIWDSALACEGEKEGGSGDRLLTAMADGTWHELRLPTAASLISYREASRSTSAWKSGLTLELLRVIPRIPGADRALSVSASMTLHLAAGTDDARNVIAWRLSGGSETEHRSETLWTAKLPKGIGMTCCVCSGGGQGRAVVAVGSSAGEVVLLDAMVGLVVSVFSHHRGPVVALTLSRDSTALYATGWHESLRCYHCLPGDSTSLAGDSAGSVGLTEWAPGEVKRRTHYHEATQLRLMGDLLLSASRDGTLLYAPESALFRAPANYLSISTQQFAFAAERNILLHTRYSRIEAFYPDSARRHWVPLFAYASHGSYHLSGLWSDKKLHVLVFATDERVVVLALDWAQSIRPRQGRTGPDGLQLKRIEQRCEAPALRGVIDVVFSGGEETEDEAAETFVYVLQDDQIVVLSTTPGAPRITTPLTSLLKKDERTLAMERPRLEKLHWASSQTLSSTKTTHSSSSMSLVASGPDGALICPVLPGGVLDVEAAKWDSERAFLYPRTLPVLGAPTPSSPSSSEAEHRQVQVGLSLTHQRYICGEGIWGGSTAPIVDPLRKDQMISRIALPARFFLPPTLPQDITFVAQVHPEAFFHFAPLFASVGSSHNTGGGRERGGREAPRRHEAGSTPSQFSVLLIGYFSRGVVVVTESQWKMLYRGYIEFALTLQAIETKANEGEERRASTEQIVLLERNLEKTLESLPLCWRVKRFGN